MEVGDAGFAHEGFLGDEAVVERAAEFAPEAVVVA